MNTLTQNITNNTISTSGKLHWNFVDITIYLHFFIPSYILFKQPFEFYITYVFIIAYLPFLLLKYPVPRGVWWMLIILLITGILNVWLDNNTYKNFFKIYLNIAVNLLFYSTVIAYYNFNVEEMFRRYLKGAVIVCIFGIIEWLAWNTGTSALIDLRNYGFNKWGFTPGGLGIRVNATYPEPAFFAEFVSPAAFIAVYNLFFSKNTFLKKWESLVIITAFLLSFSSLAYTAIFITLILLLLNYGLVRYIVFAVPFGIFLFYILYNNIEEFKDRIDGLKIVFIDEYLLEEKDREVTNEQAYIARQNRVLKKVHGSPLVLYNNYYIAMQNFRQNPLFGTGLGSHEIAFQKYNLSFLVSKWYLFNAPDANSMGLRIISELGLMGIIFTFLFIRNYFVNRNSGKDKHSWVISSALLCIIIIQLLRQGNYTFSGFLFFGFLYYYNKVQSVIKNENV